MRRAGFLAVIVIALTVGVALSPGSAPAARRPGRSPVQPGGLSAVHAAGRSPVHEAPSSGLTLQAQMAALRRSLGGRLGPARTTAPMAPLAGPGACFVGAGECSLTPCIEFVGQAGVPTVPSYVVRRLATRCVSRPKVSAAAVPAVAEVVAVTPAQGAGR